MGNRVSISFINKTEESVTLFSHWGGKEFVDTAVDYVEDLRRKVLNPDSLSDPISRLEPATVMVDFIRAITVNVSLVRSDLYLGKDCKCGDNSDNGHFKIDLKTAKAKGSK